MALLNSMRLSIHASIGPDDAHEIYANTFAAIKLPIAHASTPFLNLRALRAPSCSAVWRFQPTVGSEPWLKADQEAFNTRGDGNWRHVVHRNEPRASYGQFGNLIHAVKINAGPILIIQLRKYAHRHLSNTTNMIYMFFSPLPRCH